MTTTDSKPLFSLSTDVVEALQFEIDGHVYRLKTLSHLTRAEEAHFRALISRESVIDERLRKCKKSEQDKADRLATQLLEIRRSVLELMADVPGDVLDKLTPPQQVRIMSYIGKDPADLANGDADDDDSGDIGDDFGGDE